MSCEVQCSLYCHLFGNFFVTVIRPLVSLSSNVILRLRHKNLMESPPPSRMESSPIKQSLLSCLFSLLIYHLIVHFCFIKGNSSAIQILLLCPADSWSVLFSHAPFIRFMFTLQSCWYKVSAKYFKFKSNLG